MKKYLLHSLLTCFFFSPIIYAEAIPTAAPISDYNPSYTKENPPKVPPGSYYYVKEKLGNVTPASDYNSYHIKEGPTPDYVTEKPIKVASPSAHSSHSVKTTSRRTRTRPKTRTTPDYNPYFVPFDIVIFRPLGLATTIAGTALFIVMSPFTALSAIAPPHNAFERVADVFIVVPATYTFLRPMGKVLCPGDCRPADIK